MIDKVIIAGSGGQGIEMSGELLAEAAMFQGLEVTHFPSYGAQVRGGHAYCHVVIAEGEVFSPIVERPLTLIALEQSAYDKYALTVRADGLILVNSSLVTAGPVDGVRTIAVPATEKAIELGNVLVANMIIMGAYHAARGVMDRDSFLESLKGHLTGKKAALFDIDRQAFDLGAALCRAAR